uniref:DUF4246 domain-containing protein n=1 Tax=Compsopogon caeruleus TaxID=31354 RepID=A0A7S1XG14_9RHOD
MSHENIVCTGLYIVDRDHAISGGDLLFKRAFYSHEAVEIFMGVTRDRPVITDRVIASGLLPLGRLATDSGRMIVYPNSHVHKVSRMVNQGNTVAKSRIVIFFLVDPGLRMLCTLDVAPQQLIVSREEAEMHRLSLMEERKNHKQDWNIREIELCEH